MTAPSTQGKLTLSATTPQSGSQQLSFKKVSMGTDRCLPLTPASSTKAAWPCPTSRQVQAGCPQVPAVLRARLLGRWHCFLCGHPMHRGWALSTAAGVLLPDRFSGARCPPGGCALGEDCCRSQALVLAGKWLFKLGCDEAAPQVGLSFSAMCPDPSNRVQRADFESLVTCMEGSVRLGMCCGCICSAGTKGGAGWGGPAGKLGCFRVSLWVLDLSWWRKARAVGKVSALSCCRAETLPSFKPLGEFPTCLWGNAATNSEIA